MSEAQDVVKILMAAVKRNPNLRVGQLIMNSILSTADLYYLSDFDLGISLAVYNSEPQKKGKKK